MSSANKQERGSLEEQFRSRMQDAEALPTPDLWARIDHDLTVAENKRYKERFVMYRQLAAACFVLFMLAGALWYFQIGNQAIEPVGTTDPQMAANSTSTRPDATANNELTTETTVPAQPQAQAGAIAAVEQDNTKLAPASAEESYKSRTATGNGTAQRAAAVAPPKARQLQQEGGNDLGQPTYASAIEAEQPAELQEISVLPIVPDTKNTTSKVQSVVVRQRLPQEKSLSLPEALQAPGEPQYKTLAAASMLEKDEKENAVEKSIGKSSDKKQAYANASDSRWSVGMASGPSYFNQNIGLPEQMMPAVMHNSFAATGPTADAFSARNMESAREEYDENTDAAFSYGMEVRAGFRLTKKLKLLSGLGFIQNSARTKTSFIFRQFWYKPTTREPYELVSTIFMPSLTNGFSPDSIAVEQTNPFYVNYQYRQITVPIGLQYEGEIGSKGWHWYASGALAANFLTESKISTTSDKIPDFSYNNNKGEVSPFRKVQFSSNIGAGIGKHITESVSVVVGPEFRSYLSSMLANPDQALAPQGKPYSIGVNLGVQYMLGQNKK
ncbi:PorT family protein [Pontibacter sp. 13R65]|uniref:PorT family protein n=1 Tax=Pontibacter sp. 13R65 TaxID=3127458 RepID=UPI00301BDA05